MAQPVTMLIVDGRPGEVSRIVGALRRADFEPRWTRAASKADFLRRLDGQVDLILAWGELPSPDVRSMLEDLGASGLDVPLIVVSASRPDSAEADEWFAPVAISFVSRLDLLGDAVRRALRVRELARETGRLEQQLRTRERQQTALAALGRRALATPGDLGELFAEAVEVVARTLDVEFAKVLELLPGGDRLLLRAGVGWEDGLVGTATVGTELDSQAGYTLLADGPVLVDDLRAETRFTGPPLLIDHGIVSGLSAPIAIGVGPFGVLGAHTAERRSFSSDDASFLQSVANVLGTAVARKHVEDTLRVSEERFRALVEHTWDGVAISDREGVCRYVTPSVIRITGYEAEELVGQSGLPSFVHPDDLSWVVERFGEVLQGGSPAGPIELRIRHKDGSWRWLEGVSTNLLDDPAVAGIVFNFREVTEHKAVEAALRGSEETHRSVVENLAEGISILVGGRRVFVNDAWRQIHGLSARDEVIGTLVNHFLVPEEREIVQQRALARERGEEPPARHLYHIRRPDGEIRAVEVSAARITYGGEPAVLGAIRDVTPREQATLALRQREDELRQAQKMEALGLLAGGVAHDFNNLLTTIIGHGDLAARQLPAGSLPHTHVSEITAAAERAAALTRQLLAVSRRQVLAPEVLDLNRLLEEMEALLRRVIGEDIDLVAIHDPNLPRVRVDRGQMEQVIMNLAVNARDAMPHGGTLTISTANAPKARTGGHVQAPAAASQVMVLVSDTGVGMDPEIRSRALEPFFTTKEKGRGTGLGLSIVYGIVSQSGGTIRIQSTQGKGTRVEIRLPRAETEVDAASRPPTGPDVSPGHETILVIEDDAQVRTVARLTLESLSYRVLESGSGNDAVARAAEHPGPIDLLLSDVVLPGMTGPEAARAITARRPETRVLFMSGYLGEEGSLAGALGSDSAFLAKPFTAGQLGRKVREVLDALPTSSKAHP